MKNRMFLILPAVMLALSIGLVGCGTEYGADLAKHTLTISSTDGGSNTCVPSLDCTCGEGTESSGGLTVPEECVCAEGTEVSIEATPDTGYRFKGWTGDVKTVADVNAAKTTITMNDDYSITANFVRQYGLTISSTTGGSVTMPGEGIHAYDEGEVVNLVAQAEEGYRFVSWTGDVGTVKDVSAAQTTITTHGSYWITANFARKYTAMVAVGEFYTVGLKDDGTLVTAGYCEDGHCDVSSWTDLIQVAAGESYTVGLKGDGTVVAVGDNAYGQCNVGNWTGIVQVAVGEWHTVGLKGDGTLVAVGDNGHGQCDVSIWTDIIQVAAGVWHTVGLKNDGTLVTVGYCEDGQCDVSSWTDIIQVAAGGHTVGLKGDGTVVAAGGCDWPGPCDVGSWTDIIQVAAGPWHTVGLRSDGTVVAVGINYGNDVGQYVVGSWTNVIEVAANYWNTVGIKANGTVIAVGGNAYGQCNVQDWMLK